MKKIIDWILDNIGFLSVMAMIIALVIHHVLNPTYKNIIIKPDGSSNIIISSVDLMNTFDDNEYVTIHSASNRIIIWSTYHK